MELYELPGYGSPKSQSGRAPRMKLRIRDFDQVTNRPPRSSSEPIFCMVRSTSPWGPWGPPGPPGDFFFPGFPRRVARVGILDALPLCPWGHHRGGPEHDSAQTSSSEPIQTRHGTDPKPPKMGSAAVARPCPTHFGWFWVCFVPFWDCFVAFLIVFVALASGASDLIV